MIAQTLVGFLPLLEFLFKPRTLFKEILLPGHVVGSPSLEVLEIQADKTMGSLLA